MNQEIIVIESDHQLSDKLEKLERLAKNADQVSRNRRSPNTLRGYKADWEDFNNWCNEYGFQSLPAAPHVVKAYLSDRAVNSWIGASGRLRKPIKKSPLKLPTLLHRLWGIKYKHREKGYFFDIEHNDIQDILDSLRNSNTAKEVRKDPLLLNDIRGMIENLPDTITGIRDKAILLIGFVCALRRSEIAYLAIEDLKFVEEGIELNISQSKTGARDLVIPYGSNPLSCPVRALKKWLQVADIPLNRVDEYQESKKIRVPIFRSINKHGHISNQSLTGAAIALIVKRNGYVKGRIALAIEKEEHLPSYAGHSLRAGFVTEAILQEVPEHLITAQTGHKKRETLEKYIRIANKWKHNAAIKLGL